MAEPCDPEVLHARLCVVESNSKRHEGDLEKIFERVGGLEVCASCLPRIESALIDIQKKVDELRISIASRDATVKAEYDSNKGKGLMEKWQTLIAPLLASVLTGLTLFALALWINLFKGP